jgi:hypothetical protein
MNQAFEDKVNIDPMLVAMLISKVAFRFLIAIDPVSITTRKS